MYNKLNGTHDAAIVYTDSMANYLIFIKSYTGNNWKIPWFCHYNIQQFKNREYNDSFYLDLL